MAKRSDNEKKTVTKSMKLSHDVAEYIEVEADKLDMNFSQYMTYCALHRESAINPEILCRIENIIELCRAFIDDDKVMTKVRKEVDELWDCLK